MDVQDPCFGEFFSDVSGTFVGMVAFVEGHLVFVFVSEPVWVGVTGAGFICETFDTLTLFTESLEISVDGTEGDVGLLMHLLGSLFILQDRTDQFIALDCIHSVASSCSNVIR